MEHQLPQTPPHWLQAMFSQQNTQLQNAISPLLQGLEATETCLLTLTQQPHANKVTRGPHPRDNTTTLSSAPDRNLVTEMQQGLQMPNTFLLLNSLPLIDMYGPQLVKIPRHLTPM